MSRCLENDSIQTWMLLMSDSNDGFVLIVLGSFFKLQKFCLILKSNELDPGVYPRSETRIHKNARLENAKIYQNKTNYRI